MAEPEQYRQQARWCLDLANGAEDQFSRDSLRELAAEYFKAADELEQAELQTGSLLRKS
jgi:hypothetical protein